MIYTTGLQCESVQPGVAVLKVIERTTDPNSDVRRSVIDASGVLVEHGGLFGGSYLSSCSHYLDGVVELHETLKAAVPKVIGWTMELNSDVRQFARDAIRKLREHG